MYLDNYHCDWDHIQIVLKNADNTRCDSLVFERPREMWNNILGQWEMYCPADVNKAFQLSLGDDVNFEGYNEDERIVRVTFTRADGYQIAIVRFLRRDNYAAQKL